MLSITIARTRHGAKVEAIFTNSVAQNDPLGVFLQGKVETLTAEINDFVAKEREEADAPSAEAVAPSPENSKIEEVLDEARRTGHPVDLAGVEKIRKDFAETGGIRTTPEGTGLGGALDGGSDDQSGLPENSEIRNRFSDLEEAVKESEPAEKAPAAPEPTDAPESEAGLAGVEGAPGEPGEPGVPTSSETDTETDNLHPIAYAFAQKVLSMEEEERTNALKALEGENAELYELVLRKMKVIRDAAGGTA